MSASELLLLQECATNCYIYIRCSSFYTFLSLVWSISIFQLIIFRSFNQYLKRKQIGLIIVWSWLLNNVIVPHKTENSKAKYCRRARGTQDKYKNLMCLISFAVICLIKRKRVGDNLGAQSFFYLHATNKADLFNDNKHFISGAL